MQNNSILIIHKTGKSILFRTVGTLITNNNLVSNAVC